MSTITIAIVILFVIGYLCIALETVTKINKAAIALIMLGTVSATVLDKASSLYRESVLDIRS